MPSLILITGPIGAGKNTVASLVAAELRAGGRSTAVVDLDDVVFMQGFDLDDAGWWRGRVAHAALTGGWFRAGIDTVIAHGPICTTDEMEALVADIPAELVPHRALLRVPLEESIKRVLTDTTRRPEAGSRVVSFLSGAYEHFAKVEMELPLRWDFDTTTLSPGEISATISGDLLSS